MANNYTLSLSAQVSQAGLQALQTQLDNWSKSYVAQINAQIKQVQESAQQSSSGDNSGAMAASQTEKAAAGVAKMNAAVSQLNLTSGQYNKTSETTNALTGQLTKVTASQNLGAGQLEKTTLSLNEATGKFKTTTVSTTDATKTFGGEIIQTVEKVIKWAAVMGVIYGSLRQLKDGIQYIVDLNQAMTNTQMVTGFSDVKIQELTHDYHNMAMELGATTLEIQQASLSWLRQGKSAEDATKLTQASIMMSKLAMTDAASASEYLTAIMNGFKMSATDVTGVMDKMLALSNSTKTSAAVSFGTISEAMKVSASEANNVGISFDQLASYISVIGTTTQQSGETIGNSLKMMMTRMAQVKANVSEGADSFNNVQTVLQKYGMTLLDTTGSFKPLGDVIDEVGGKWATLDKFQQMQLVTAIAGAKQANSMLALMDNYSNALKYQTAETDSAGLAANRYAIYQDNVEAAMNRSKAAWEGFWRATVQSGQIKWFYDLSTSVGEFAAKIGGLQPILMVVGGLLIAFNSTAIVGAFAKLGAMIGEKILEFEALAIAEQTAAIGVVPILGAIVIALGIGATAWSAYHKFVQDSIENSDKKVQEFSNSIAKLQTDKSSLANLWGEFEKLRDKTYLTNEEQQRFIDLQNQIVAISPTAVTSYDALGNAIIGASIKLDDLNKKTEEQILDQQKLAQAEIESGAKARVKSLNEQVTALKNLQEQNDYFEKSINEGGASSDIANAWGLNGQNEADLKTKKAVYAAQKMALDDFTQGLITDYKKLDDEGKKYLLDLLKSSGVAGQELAHQLEIIPTSAYNISSFLDDYNLRQIKSADVTEQTTEEIKKFIDATEAVTSAFEAVTSAQEEQSKSGSISAETAIKLVEAHTVLKDSLTQTADGYYLDADGARAALQAEMQLLFTSQGLGAAAIEAAKGNYVFAASAIAASSATAEEKKAMLDLLASFAAMGNSVAAVGGAGESAASKVKTLLDMVVQYIRFQKEEEKKALQEQLDNYTKIIDAQKEKLKLLHDEQDYKDEINDKNKSISRTQMELDSLALDNSEEAKKRRLELQDELGKETKDLSKTQRDHQYEEEQDSLDKELQSFKDTIQSQIDAIDKYLSEPGTIMKDAMKMVQSQGDSLYNSLIAWNSVYGSGIDTDVTEAWKNAIDYVNAYIDALNNIPAVGGGIGSSSGPVNPKPKVTSGNIGMPKASGGLVIGGIPGMDSVNTNLMPGEYVFDKNSVDAVGVSSLDRMRNALRTPYSGGVPATNNIGGGKAVIGTLLNINVDGSLDKSVIPNIQQIASQVMGELNNVLFNRGYRRSVNQYVS